MHWFSGIGWNTPMREVGWVYVIIFLLLLILPMIVLHGGKDD